MKPNDIIQFAQRFAAEAHAQTGQTYDGKPYSVHLEHVVKVLLRFGATDKTTLAAGYLHDLMEDVGVKPETVADLFGPEVTALVCALTDEPGANRKERKLKTYPKIRATPGATMLKLADRIANVENSADTLNQRMFLMYRKEHGEFERNLRDFTSEAEKPMWDHLTYLFNAVKM